MHLQSLALHLGNPAELHHISQRKFLEPANIGGQRGHICLARQLLTVLRLQAKPEAGRTAKHLLQLHSRVLGDGRVTLEQKVDVFGRKTRALIALIEHEAGECLKAADGINFENKIVLAIAIRLAAEKFMVTKINDPAFVAGIDSNQTPRLLKKFRELFSAEVATINVLQQVVLMTPENIHLNSFMYEPILDMSDGHLRKLYGEVTALV